MTAREKLAVILSPAMAALLDAYVAERVRAELGAVSAERMASRQRPELLNVQEAADLLRANKQRVYDLVSSGRLPKLNDGSRVLIRRADLEAYLDGGAR